MTAITLSRRPHSLSGRSGRWRRRRPEQPRHRPLPGDIPPLSPRLQFARAVLVLLCVLSVTLLLQLVVLSALQQRAAQGRAYDTFRARLASGTAPIGPTDDAGNIVPNGTPVAYLEIPAIDLEEVVGQGTSPRVLFDGPGHRRDTPLPGQIGSSVLFGRRAAFGGPFASIDELKEQDTITVTTGQGVFTYRVIALVEDGDTAPAAPAAGTSRLTLVTAAGSAFLPNGVLRVYADLEGQAVVGPSPIVSSAALPGPERLMANDGRSLWALALWLQALIGLSVGVVWAWHRWGRAQMWIVFLPPLMLVGLSAAGEGARLLPNLL